MEIKKNILYYLNTAFFILWSMYMLFTKMVLSGLDVSLMITLGAVVVIVLVVAFVYGKIHGLGLLAEKKTLKIIIECFFVAAFLGVSIMFCLNTTENYIPAYQIAGIAVCMLLAYGTARFFSNFAIFAMIEMLLWPALMCRYLFHMEDMMKIVVIFMAVFVMAMIFYMFRDLIQVQRTGMVLFVLVVLMVVGVSAMMAGSPFQGQDILEVFLDFEHSFSFEGIDKYYYLACLCVALLGAIRMWYDKGSYNCIAVFVLNVMLAVITCYGVGSEYTYIMVPFLGVVATSIFGINDFGIAFLASGESFEHVSIVKSGAAFSGEDTGGMPDIITEKNFKDYVKNNKDFNYSEAAKEPVEETEQKEDVKELSAIEKQHNVYITPKHASVEETKKETRAAEETRELQMDNGMYVESASGSSIFTQAPGEGAAEVSRVIASKKSKVFEYSENRADLEEERADAGETAESVEKESTVFKEQEFSEESVDDSKDMEDSVLSRLEDEPDEKIFTVLSSEMKSSIFETEDDIRPAEGRQREVLDETEILEESLDLFEISTEPEPKEETYKYEPVPEEYKPESSEEIYKYEPEPEVTEPEPEEETYRYEPEPEVTEPEPEEETYRYEPEPEVTEPEPEEETYRYEPEPEATEPEPEEETYRYEPEPEVTEPEPEEEAYKYEPEPEATEPEPEEETYRYEPEPEVTEPEPEEETYRYEPEPEITESEPEPQIVEEELVEETAEPEVISEEAELSIVEEEQFEDAIDIDDSELIDLEDSLLDIEEDIEFREEDILLVDEPEELFEEVSEEAEPEVLVEDEISDVVLEEEISTIEETVEEKVSTVEETAVPAEEPVVNIEEENLETSEPEMSTETELLPAEEPAEYAEEVPVIEEPETSVEESVPYVEEPEMSVEKQVETPVLSKAEQARKYLEEDDAEEEYPSFGAGFGLDDLPQGETTFAYSFEPEPEKVEEEVHSSEYSFEEMPSVPEIQAVIGEETPTGPVIEVEIEEEPQPEEELDETAVTIEEPVLELAPEPIAPPKPKKKNYFEDDEEDDFNYPSFDSMFGTDGLDYTVQPKVEEEKVDIEEVFPSFQGGSVQGGESASGDPFFDWSKVDMDAYFEESESNKEETVKTEKKSDDQMFEWTPEMIAALEAENK